MEVIDLTHTLHTGVPVYPGSKQARLVKVAGIGSDGFQETFLHMSAHTGTHIDCGRHFLINGSDTANSSPDSFFGKGVIIDCRNHTEINRISRSHLQTYEDRMRQTDFVLILTGWSRFWGDDRYFSEFLGLDLTAAQYLSGFRLKGIGIDGPSFDQFGSPDFPVHKQFLPIGMFLIENLTNLELLLNREFLFSCFPLKIKEGDGSPVRAVGIVTGDK